MATLTQNTNYIISTHNIESNLYKNFMVDLVVNNAEKSFEAYLYHKDYGVKELIYGFMQSQTSATEFMSTVQSNVEGFIHSYIENYVNQTGDSN